MEHLYPLQIGSTVVLDTKPSLDWEHERPPDLPSKPCARSGHCAVADEHNVYLLGGYNPDHILIADYFGDDHIIPLFGEVWRYHIPSNRWHLLTNEGESHFRLASMSAILKGKTLLIYGGTSFPFGYQSTNKISLYDLKKLQWHHKPEKDEQKPIRSYGQAIAAIGPHLYVYGGTTGWVYCSDVHRCNVQTGVWERVFSEEEHATALIKQRRQGSNAVPEARYRHEMMSDEKRLYVIGGGTSDQAFSLEKLHAFDTENKEWELLETRPDSLHGFPGARRCHGCAQLGKVGYITGGFDGQTIFEDIWKLDLTTLQWTKLETKLHKPVYFHSSAINPNGCLFIHGGVLDANGKKRSDTLTRVWVQVPSLLHMAWNRFLSCLRDPNGIKKETLQALGVPPSLLPDIG